MSPNKEGAVLHHEAEMGKWNTLKHGCWDVLLCCCGNTYGMRGFGVVREGGRGESSFRSLKEICACAPSSCACVRLCEALATYSVCIPLLFSFGVQRQPFVEMKSASAGLLAQVANVWRMELWWIVPAAVCVTDWISLHGKYTYPLLSCTVPFSFLSEQHWLQLITIICN